MSQGRHRATKPGKTRRPGLRRLAAGLSIAAAAATGIGLTATGALNAPTDDTGWGAPDTSLTPADTGWGSPSDGSTTGPGTVTTYDTGWG